MNNIKVATQIASLKVLILAEAAKEYEATWLKDAKTVLRDGTGRFAKKGNSTESDSSSKEDSAQMDAKSISKSLRSSSFRQEAGLSPGAAMDTVINNIYGAKKDDSSFMDKFNELHDEIADELSKFFGKDNPELGKSIKKGGIPLPKNDSLDNFLEFAIARYKASVDRLKHIGKKPSKQEIIGEAINSAIPVAISAAIATLPSVLLPALAEGKFNWKTILVSAVVGQAANFAAQEGLDAAGIDDPVIRRTASLVAGILAGGLASGVAIKNKEAFIKKAEAEAAEKAANLKKWEEYVKVDKAESEAKRAKLAKETKESSSAKAKDLATKRGQEIIDALHDETWLESGKKELRDILRSQRKPGVDDSSYIVKAEGAITEEEKEAIKAYTRTGYENVNKILRHGVEAVKSGSQKKKALKEIELIHSGLSKLPGYKAADAFLVRFVGLKHLNPEELKDFVDEKYVVGENIVEPSFLSVSHSVTGTGKWRDHKAENMSVKFVIRPNEKSVARDITHLNENNEKEALYPPGMKFKVVDKYLHKFDAAIYDPASSVMKMESEGKSRFNDVWVIELEEI